MRETDSDAMRVTQQSNWKHQHLTLEGVKIYKKHDACKLLTNGEIFVF